MSDEDQKTDDGYVSLISVHASPENASRRKESEEPSPSGYLTALAKDESGDDSKAGSGGAKSFLQRAEERSVDEELSHSPESRPDEPLEHPRWGRTEDGSSSFIGYLDSLSLTFEKPEAKQEAKEEEDGSAREMKSELSSQKQRTCDQPWNSTMESDSFVLDNENASSTMTSDDAIDQPTSRSGADRPPEDEEIRGFVESARLASNDSTLRDNEEVFETDTFDDDYSRNIDLTQRYLEKMMTRPREDGYFRNHWLKRSKMSLNSLIRRRSPQRAARKSAERRKDATTASDLQRGSPILKLRLRTARSSRQVQAAERPGNAVHLGEEIANR